MWNKIRLHQIFLIAVYFSLTACAGKRVSSSEDFPPQAMGPVIPNQEVEEQPVANESYGPAMPAEGVIPAEPSVATSPSTDSEISVPVQPSTESPKLCLVLSPGLAKAMSQAAVLASLKKAKIPVHCVVGTEMGAVVGALYAFSNGSPNSLQWQLFKLSKDTYFNFPMLSLNEPLSNGRKLNEFFQNAFKNKKLEELPISFATTAVDEERDTGVEFTSGDLADALSASVAIPGIFDPWKMREGVFHSSAVSDPVPIELARKLGGNFIVLVDVLSDSGSKTRFQKAFAPVRSLLKLRRKEASFVIQINTAKIPFEDFSRQGEILAAGTAATEKARPELKAAWESWSAGTR